MKDLFTAHDDVMRYLCQNNNIHDIPLGNDWTEKNADKVRGWVIMKKIPPLVASLRK